MKINFTSNYLHVHFLSSIVHFITLVDKNQIKFNSLAVSVKLRQSTGQTQDNFNFGMSLLKFENF